MIIKAQKGRGSKIHLLLDDEYRITTDADFWAENFIKDGTDIDDEEWENLVTKINYRKSFNKCADLLSRRDHSVKELKEKLLRTVDEASADKAIERFLELGYLDDEKFAKALAKHLYEVKNYSDNHVRQELYKRGISREIVYDIIDNSEIDSIETIINLVIKKYYNKLNAENGKEKVVAALMRKGFSYGDIKTALHRIENKDYV
ncbi:MAG: regulatory protein RecX [Eubacterium sp.]|jgi:regulatory protein|nr:regulatory protein RecX [Eubacterium sp.]